MIDCPVVGSSFKESRNDCLLIVICLALEWIVSTKHLLVIEIRYYMASHIFLRLNWKLNCLETLTEW